MGLKIKLLLNNVPKIVWLLFAIIFVILILAFSSYILMNSRTFQLFGGLTDRVQTNNKIVALTFDDGPDVGSTEGIIEILGKNEVKGTFFLTGKSIDKNKKQTEKLVEAGHQIGNHSYSHNMLVFMSPENIRNEINSTNNSIRNAGYNGEIMFRPPYGKKLVYLPYYLKQSGMKTIMWDIEPDSYGNVPGSTENIISKVTETVSPGSIIILHAMGDNVATRNAIEPTIKKLKADGYKFVTVEQLLRSN